MGTMIPLGDASRRPMNIPVVTVVFVFALELMGLISDLWFQGLRLIGIDLDWGWNSRMSEGRTHATCVSG